MAFEAAEEPLTMVALDPSRGAILSLVVQTPALDERLAQGGRDRLSDHRARADRRRARYRAAACRWRLPVAAAVQALAHDDAEHPIGQLRAIAQNPDYLKDADALSAKMDEIVTVASQRLNRGLPMLAIFAAVSPLLGLLGTVTGMIETFQVITLFGAGDPRLMSGGISQALITTQLGLAVAIPAAADSQLCAEPGQHADHRAG